MTQRKALRKLDIYIREHCGSFLLSGADIIGINCISGPSECLEAIKLMKKGLEEAGIKRHLMIQPLAYHIPDGLPCGYFEVPEFPFGMYF